MGKKNTLVLLLICLICLCTACSAAPVEPDTSVSSAAEGEASPTTGTVSLAFSSTDSLDPYTAVTKYNKELCELLYDSLITLDENFSPVYRLASSVTLAGKNCTVVLADARFSDGSTVTAEDVVYSLQKAKKSETRYATQLAGVSSCSASGAKTVEITLSKSDPYFTNLLDFPILKKGSDELKNQDGKVLPPIGGGRYIYQADSMLLAANPTYRGGALSLETIQLVETPDDEALSHNIEVGNISISYSDLSSNTPLRMTGKNLSVGLNNLVYLGINFGNGYLSEPRFRQAVSLAVDRQKIAASAYIGYAAAANGPFPSSWKEAAGLQTMSSTPEISRAVALLEEIGYNTKDGDGYRLNAGGRRITLTLLCNLDNTARTAAAELLKEQLAAVGIELSVRTVNWNAYLSELSSGSFDLYIGEVKLQGNMDLSALVTEKSGACFGYIKTPRQTASSTSSASSASAVSAVSAVSASSGSSAASLTDENVPYVTVSAYDIVNDMYKGEATLADVLAAFNSELPVIPLCHRAGQLAYSSRIRSTLTPTVSDLFSGIETIAFGE